MSETKTCTKCGKTYPATAEYFWRRPSVCYCGLTPRCKACGAKYQRSITSNPAERESKANYEAFLRRLGERAEARKQEAAG